MTVRVTFHPAPCMSSTWRYVVRPDCSFYRVGNLDGSLDDVSDQELA
ncbi:hypothetical protein GCM10023323_66740 [Streptomyces thinghirensis]|uniref:Uncharacterized protein n=1 Tax=Streptomyces thinghirensis TaxID=551547 RepID=A0ABP9TF61_9ACTN